ncbi:MAG: D-alanyl-D-alanine carboxypeptidase family protein [Acidobacteriota bacterium]
MDRRLTAVFTTVMLSILALVDAAASTSNKPTREKRPAAISSRASSSTRSRASRIPAARGARPCAPCAGALAKNRRGRSIKKSARIAKNLPCHPKNYINPKLARSYNAALRDMKRAGIKPKVTSLWRSSENQAQLHRCSLSTRCRRANPGLYRALPPGKSLHEAGFAVDMAGIAAGPRGQKRLTRKGRRIVGIMRKNGFKWRYGLADPAHFEADPRKHGYRTSRQAIARSQTTCQINLVKTKARKHTANKVAAGRPQAPAKARFPGDAAVTKARRPTGRVRA